ncbi:MAG: hypothetical protein AB1486_03670 [Planctomycetota bacterium]
MNPNRPPPLPLRLALFEKMLAGDDALLELARCRFQEAGLGAEFHASAPQELARLLRFRPSEELPVTVHLDRSLNLFQPADCKRILTFASRFRGQLHGLVMHDQPDILTRLEDYVACLRDLERELGLMQDAPLLFVEYAVFLPPQHFIELFAAASELEHVSACIDTGHLGLYQVHAAFAEQHPEVNAPPSNPHDVRAQQWMNDIQEAVAKAPQAVFEMIRALAAFGKPLHFHLHDGHPLSQVSPMGVSDHVSFLQRIAIPFEYQGQSSLAPMFGTQGLEGIVAETLEHLAADKVSFTLEIHPSAGRLPLGEGAPLFKHWRHLENAERMNHWLAVLVENDTLLRAACGAVRKAR